jgi:hypothetical protein
LFGDYAYISRNDIDQKNLLAVGKVSLAKVVAVLKKSRGTEHSCSPHHQDETIEVHVIVCGGMYIKFYFDPDTVFLSVHQEGDVS